MSDLAGGPIEGAQAHADDDVQRWLASLSRLVAELVERWELALGEPFAGASIGYTVAATRAGVDAVVLKITVPDGWFPETVGALVGWDGDGAVELIDHDPRGALLLERALPGAHLSGEPDEDAALLVAAGVMERLWIPGPPGITRVVDEVGRWAATFRDRNDALGSPVPRELADEAVGSMEELIASPREERLLHGDLHLGNVLEARREPWLAISPKPLVGDREFDVSTLIRDSAEAVVREAGAPGRMHHRLDVLAERLSCDRERLRAWSLAVAAGSALASWEDGNDDLGATQVAVADVLRTVRR